MLPPDPADPPDPITALTAVIAKLLPNQPSISLVIPSFDWNTIEQYDDFQLFCKAVESWLTLQNIPAEPDLVAPNAEPNSTRVCAQFPGQHWLQEVWPLEANWHSWWDHKEEKASYSLHRLPVIYDEPCSITTLQDLPTGRCSHTTRRVTLWTCWPSLHSCWLMELPNRRGKGMEYPVKIGQSPQWQGTHPKATCSWPSSNNVQDTWRMLNTHCHLW